MEDSLAIISSGSASKPCDADCFIRYSLVTVIVLIGGHEVFRIIRLDFFISNVNVIFTTFIHDWFIELPYEIGVQKQGAVARSPFISCAVAMVCSDGNGNHSKLDPYVNFHDVGDYRVAVYCAFSIVVIICKGIVCTAIYGHSC